MLVRTTARIGLLLLLLVSLMRPPAAAAHPHMWIDSTVDFVLGPNGLTGIQMTWLFDEFSSSDFLVRFNLQRVTAFTAAQSDVLYNGTFRHLVNSGYFIRALVDNRPVVIPELMSFRASRAGDRLQYDFTIPLEVGWSDLDRLEVALFDESYFVSFMLTAGSSNYRHGGRTVTVAAEPIRLATQGWGRVTVGAVRTAVQ